MQSKRKVLILLIVLVVFIGGSAAAYTVMANRVDVPPPELAEEPEDNEAMLAPDFMVYDSDGEGVRLSDLRGKPVVLNFWASWCPPCKSEMPEFNSVFAEYGENINFMMVDLVDGERETQEIGAAFVQKQGFSFPVYYDSGLEALITYGVTSIPTTYFIDRDGYLITGVRGGIDRETLLLGIEMIRE